LIGDKLYLRPLERADAPFLTSYMNDPDVTRTLEARRPMSLQGEEAWIDSLCKSDREVVLGIVVKKTDRLIGATDLHEIRLQDRKAGFGIAIGAKDEWNKGYGSEATRLMLKYGFQTLNLHRIVLRVYANNPHALRTYERAGYVHEGILRKDVYRDGRYIDVYLMAVLREDWESAQGQESVVLTEL
jgi:RimJ/RimL family protein N-acetyltransferase